jgi:putative transposase
MDTREVVAEYRMAKWAQTIQARIQAGQSIKEFCATSGISRNAYFYWQRKLREAACSEIQETATEVKNCLIPNGWARLESVEADRAEASLTIEVSGCRITTTDTTDLELLAKVCRTLRSL